MKALARVPKSPYASKLEADYAEHLEGCVRARLLRAWRYEPISFILGKGNRYAPDFMLVNEDGTIDFVEVKGWSQSHDRSRVKWKTAAALNPEFGFLWITRKKKGAPWSVEEYD